MTSMNRRAFAHAMLAAGRAAAGVRAHAENAPATPRIGYQKSSTPITLLKTRGTLAQALTPPGLRVSWHEFASGLPLTEALNVGAIDFSADVADTVPVFAQAAHARFVYVAQEAPSPEARRSSSSRTARYARSPISTAGASRSRRRPAATTCCLRRSPARSSRPPTWRFIT